MSSTGTAFTHKVGGVLVDCTSAVLRDKTGAFGVQRTDTGAAVVAAGTAMTHDSLGKYSAVWTDEAYDLTYLIAVEVDYGGLVRHFQDTKAGTPSPAVSASALAASPIWTVTWHDLIEHGKGYLDMAASMQDELFVKRAVRNAIRRVVSERNWTYLQTRYRIALQAPYSTGTVAVNNDETQVVLTGGTWPTWAAQGEIVIGSGGPTYQVYSRDSGGTIITLNSETPYDGDDVTAASFIIQQVTYLLPDNVRKFTQPEGEATGGLIYLPPSEWHRRRRRSPTSSGDTYWFTSFGSPDSKERTAIAVHPVPSEAKTLDIFYMRWPTEMLIDYATGTVTLTEDSTTVNGAGVVWTPNAVGAILRVGNATNVPDGMDGQNPPVESHWIASRTDADTIVLDTEAEAAHATVKYRISDALDLDARVCLEAVHRAIEYEIDTLHPARRNETSRQQYMDAITSARDRDTIAEDDRPPGAYRRTHQLIADVGLGDDV